MYGKKYISSDEFRSQLSLLSNSKLGIAPSNTTLDSERTGRIQHYWIQMFLLVVFLVLGRIKYFFSSRREFGQHATKLQEVRDSIEIHNEEPINGDIQNISALMKSRVRALGSYAISR